MSPSQAGPQLFLPRIPSVWFGDWNLRGKGGALRRNTRPACCSQPLSLPVLVLQQYHRLHHVPQYHHGHSQHG